MCEDALTCKEGFGLPQLRLLGLVLFITAAFLGMAAAITQTVAIQVRNPMHRGGSPAVQGDLKDASEPTPLPAGEPAAPGGSLVQSREKEAGRIALADGDDSNASDEFITVPIVFPLVIAGMVGLLMWFLPAGLGQQPAPRQRRRKKRKR